MLSRAPQIKRFSPADLKPSFWVEAAAQNTLFTEIAGTTTPTDGGPVGRWQDMSGNDFHVTAPADDTTRPTWVYNNGVPYVEFDGVDDVLRRTTSLGMYAAGACSIFAAVRSTTQGTSDLLVSERNDTGAAGLYIPMETDNGVATISSGVIRTDASGTFFNHPAVITGAFDDTDRVVGHIDTGAVFYGWLDGALVGSPNSYTRSGVLTLNNFSVGATVELTGASGFFPCRLYALVIVKRVLSSSEVDLLSRYLRRKMGIGPGA